MSERMALSVKQLNVYIKSLLDGDIRLNDIIVKGEISNFKNHYSSGHWYFSIKDKEASVRCVMFRSSVAGVAFMPQDGMEILIRGRVSVYEKDGQYMLYVSEMHESGLGDIALKYAQTKEKLQKEGLFDEQNKRALVKYPKKIAVVTSDSGAAVRDITNILSSRYPLCEVLICPVFVQGIFAAGNIISMLKRVYTIEGVDTIIIGRGGGSAEDLAAFNGEMLARTVYESPVPIISAVGHETDFTICDFVADVRASTPSHAAELAVPDIKDILEKIEYLKSKITLSFKNKYEIENRKFIFCSESIKAEKFINMLDNKSEIADAKFKEMEKSFCDSFCKKQERFFNAVSRVDVLSPLKVMSRGFSVVKKNGITVKTVSDVDVNDKISIGFCDGIAECTVNELKSEGLYHEKH